MISATVMYAWKFAYVGGNLQRAAFKIKSAGEMCWEHSCSLSGIFCFWEPGTEFSESWSSRVLCGFKPLPMALKTLLLYAQNEPKRSDKTRNDSSFVLLAYSVDVVDKRLSCHAHNLPGTKRFPNTLIIQSNANKIQFVKWVSAKLKAANVYLNF